MPLEMNLIEIRNFQGKEKFSKLQEYKDHKENLIKEYLRIQDILDEYNDKVNTICCEIEKINIILHEMEVHK
ncbi:MAG: hypothetical protein HUU50_00735 [Candidatus Brocadiae bacterium]|nr:hypothetical protein [Candidatus Brocadiia bacterium]